MLKALNALKSNKESGFQCLEKMAGKVSRVGTDGVWACNFPPGIGDFQTILPTPGNA